MSMTFLPAARNTAKRQNMLAGKLETVAEARQSEFFWTGCFGGSSMDAKLPILEIKTNDSKCRTWTNTVNGCDNPLMGIFCNGLC